jgi:hypothetical protein
MAEFKIWYYIKGRRNVSFVSVSLNETVFEAKKKIYNDARATFSKCDPQNLILTKVHNVILSMNTDLTNGLCRPITPVGQC